jgi:hypothetical protein
MLGNMEGNPAVVGDTIGESEGNRAVGEYTVGDCDGAENVVKLSEFLILL